MDINRVLARSIEIAWRYKVLWVLGFVMALTGGEVNGLNYSFGRNDVINLLNPAPRPLTPPRIEPAFLLTVSAFGLCLGILALIIVFYFRFVARGALVTFVRSVEQGTSPSLGSAWREGHRYYGRLLGLGLLFWVPLALLTFLLLVLAFLPFIGVAIPMIRQINAGQQPNPGIGPVIISGLGFLALLCCAGVFLLIVQLILHPIYEFAVRGIILEESGTIDGLARGYSRLRLNLGHVALFYIVLVGARIGWSIITTIAAIPLGVILFVVITGGAAALPLGVTIVLTLAVGLPIALALVFLGGLFQVFESNSWTEFYLALLGETSSPTPSAPGLEPAPTA
jgi:hypothetical protein